MTSWQTFHYRPNSIIGSKIRSRRLSESNESSVASTSRPPLETDKSKYHAAGTSTSFDGGDDLRILKNLRKVFKELQSNYHQSFDVDVRDQQPASIREIDPSEDDDQKRSSLNRKLHKVDVRELFKESDGRDQQTSARRNRRSHTADLIDVPKSLLKKNLGHGRG
ncbi:hypothetical protein Pst134EA_017471 [Puccinia striiformis f. sp. tritici]|uniref:hypothetical protein n=1 Tax=Puccinia striiformis f. sp. tritici TaxID=168172 RepID=UPI0020084531|nr:hypothetical protein Pst134EA_017471 [Puccinia striiformis f. sp. tritici]KAH9461161.1 hypothetical protein Pst134EA_017471 [Puccinia striiformis f. sp. tritici]